MKSFAISTIVGLLAISMMIATPTDEATPSATSTGNDIAHPVAVDPIPDDAIRVCQDCPNNDLAAAILDAPDGATIVVDGGTWDGPIEIKHPLRLVGQNGAAIDGHDRGRVVQIESDDVTFEGFEVRNSGRQFQKEDSGIYVEGQRCRILNNRILNALFGINGATAHDIEIAGNYIHGQDVSEGLRGDGIKVWYSHRALIHNNEVQYSRDMLVWYSNNVHVYENLIAHSRYGFHFMNSDDGVAERNEILNNSVGIYIMYGKRFTVRDNLLQGSRGPSGHGLGLKEVDGIDVLGNVIYDNRIGIYNDNSPFSMGIYGQFHANLIAFNDSGLGILPSARDNIYTNNSFVENLDQVTILGEGPLSGGNQWSINGRGNFWSDYTGYDADGDGVGDVPYRSQTLSEELRRQYPDLQLFRFSLAERTVDFAAEAVPVFQAQPILTDDSPLVHPVRPTNAPEPVQPRRGPQTAAVSVGLLASAAGIGWYGTHLSRKAKSARATEPAA